MTKYDVIDPHDGNDWICFLKRPNGSTSIYFYSAHPGSKFGETEGTTFEKLQESVKMISSGYPDHEYRLFRFSDGELVQAGEPVNE